MAANTLAVNFYEAINIKDLLILGMMIILNFLFAAAVDPLYLVKKKKSFCNLTEKVGSTTVLPLSTVSGSS